MGRGRAKAKKVPPGAGPADGGVREPRRPLPGGPSGGGQKIPVPDEVAAAMSNDSDGVQRHEG
jgi:hypothetical protein